MEALYNVIYRSSGLFITLLGHVGKDTVYQSADVALKAEMHSLSVCECFIC